MIVADPLVPPVLAVIVDVPVRKVLEVTVNVPCVAPAATVTEDGTVATLVLLLLKLTAVPPVGAATVSVTVPVEFVPRRTVVGFRVSDCTLGTTVTVNGAETVTPRVAEMLTIVCEVTALVFTVKVALVLSQDTVTLAGTVATPVLLLDRVTVVPENGAEEEIVTVPVTVFPPPMVVGFRVTETTCGPLIVTFNVAFAELEL